MIVKLVLLHFSIDAFSWRVRRRHINEVNRFWRGWFDGLYADGAVTGRLMMLHLHPWIMGQPWRIRHLDEVLGHICARQSVWKATGSEIIDWFKVETTR